MKTLSNVFFISIIFLMLMYNVRANAYLVTVSKPCKYEIVATRQFYPQHTVEVEYRVDSIHSLNSTEVIIRIYAQQGASEVLLHQDFIEIAQWRTVSVDVSPLQNIKYNQPITIKVVASNPSNPLVTGTGKGYVLIYREGLNHEYMILRNGTIETSTTGWCNFRNDYNCHSLPNGLYYTTKNKMDFVLNGDFSNYIPVEVPHLCWGFSGACPNSQGFWGYKYYQSSTQARFMSFVHTNVYNTLGQLLPDHPCSLDNAVITYKKVYKIVLGPFIQYPNPLVHPNYTAQIFANIVQGNGDLLYEWGDTNRPQGVEFIPDSNKVTIIYPAGSSMNESSPPHKIKLRCHNEFGSTEWKYYQVNRANQISLCPMLNFSNGRDKFYDNALLPSSKNGNEDVIEHYKTNYKGFDGSGDINFNIEETGDDYTLIDKIGVKRVTCKDDEGVAVTSKGEIINFGKGGDFKAIVNFTTDITDLLRENDNQYFEMKTGHRIKISTKNFGKYPSHILLTTSYPAYKYDIGGFVHTGKSKTDTFFVKNNENVVCIKLDPNHLKDGAYVIEAAQSFRIDKVELVNNRNSAQINGLDLLAANHSEKGDQIGILTLADQVYTELGKNQNIDLSFNNIQTATISSKTAYIIETIGRITNGSFQQKYTNSKLKNGSLRLNGNFPEPFNPTTTISFEIPTDGNVSLKVYDITGRIIRELINDYRTAGNHNVNFDGSDLASGVYFYRLEIPSGYLIRKMTLIK